MAKKLTQLSQLITHGYGGNPAGWPQFTHTDWTCPKCEHDNDPRDADGAVEVSGSVVCESCGAERPLPD